jgi:hypothetical protein
VSINVSEKHAATSLRIKMAGYMEVQEKKKVTGDWSRHSTVLGGCIGRPVNSVKVESECLSSKKKKIEATYKIISGALPDRIFTETINHKRKLLLSKEDFQERSIASSIRYCRCLYSNL